MIKCYIYNTIILIIKKMFLILVFFIKCILFLYADRHRAEGAACTVYLMPRDPFAEPLPAQTKGKGGGKKGKDSMQEKADVSRGNPVTVVLDDTRIQLLALQDRHSEC